MGMRRRGMFDNNKPMAIADALKFHYSNIGKMDRLLSNGHQYSAI
jgi:hypothetical protein